VSDVIGQNQHDKFNRCSFHMMAYGSCVMVTIPRVCVLVAYISLNFLASCYHIHEQTLSGILPVSSWHGVLLIKVHFQLMK